MSVVRLSKLAREYGTTKKDLMERLPSMGFKLKKSTVDIDDKLARKIRAILDAEKAAKEKEAAEEAAAKRAAREAEERKAREAEEAETREREAQEQELRDQEARERQAKEKAEAEKAARELEARERQAREKAEAEKAAQEQELRERETREKEAREKAAREKAAAAQPRPPSPPRKAPPAPRPSPGRPARPAAASAPPAAQRPRPRPSRPAAAKTKPAKRPEPVPEAPPAVPTVLRPLTLSEAVTVKELSEKLGLKSKDVIKRLLQRGVMVTINQTLDTELARSFVQDFGYEARMASFEEVEALEEQSEETAQDLVARPPVVTIMGHVDHGKTSLLDAIRESNIAGGEAGQITQHIGAYQVTWKERRITFVDTPGHEAFTLMRARGARVTDIVVLVVAADDGVMPQTIEAMDHARAAKVPIVVALNKVDLPQARVDRVKQQLAERDLLAEDWGGETVTVEISAKNRTGIDDLLEMLLLVADLQELRANPARHAQGVVLEAKLDRGRGPVATVLVQNGTLRMGDPFIAGAVYGKVRAMFDDYGDRKEEAPPALPIEVLGLQGLPQAGDSFQVVSDELRARHIGSIRQQQIREKSLIKSSRLNLGHLHAQITEGAIKELPIVLKGDTQGSVEVLAQTLPKLSNDKVKVRIIRSGTGAVSETDVLLAAASNAIIVGFNVRPDRKARELAEKDAVDIRLYTVIYNVTNEIESAMSGLLEPTFEEVTLGRAEIRQLFRVPKIGVIAGCYVQEGRITRDAQLRVLRDNVIVYEGKVGSLRRFKEDVGEVRNGYECGIGVANFQDIKQGDVFEAFTIKKAAPGA